MIIIIDYSSSLVNDPYQTSLPDFLSHLPTSEKHKTRTVSDRRMKKDIKPLQRSLRDLLSPQVCQIWTTTTWDPQIWQILEPLWWIPTSIYQHLPASTLILASSNGIFTFADRAGIRAGCHRGPNGPSRCPQGGKMDQETWEKWRNSTVKLTEKSWERYMSDTWGTKERFFPDFPCWWRFLGQKSNEIHTAPMETSKKSGWWCWSAVDAAVGILNSWPNCQWPGGSFFAVTCWIHFLRAINYTVPMRKYFYRPSTINGIANQL